MQNVDGRIRTPTKTSLEVVAAAQGQVPWLIRRRYGIPDGGGDEYQLLASTKKFPKKAPKSFIKSTKKVKKSTKENQLAAMATLMEMVMNIN